MTKVAGPSDKGWETVIGLEIHAQLATKSKIFSGSATAYGAPPNAQANLVDLGYPGVLPVLNGEAVRMAVKFGLAVGAQISRHSVFARKNYFYPDLPRVTRSVSTSCRSWPRAPLRSFSMMVPKRSSVSLVRAWKRTQVNRCMKVCQECRAST